MSDEKKQRDSDGPHMEKQIMTEPQEEFVADQSVPSTSMKAEKKDEEDADKASNVKPAGRQDHAMGHNFETGVEG